MVINQNQFIDVFHASHEDTPPHLVTGGRIPAENLHLYLRDEDSDRTYSTDTGGFGIADQQRERYSRNVLYTGDASAAMDFVANNGRNYIHHYRIPHSALSGIRFGDDMATTDHLPHQDAHYGDRQPSLFESVPLSNRHVVASGRVSEYVNRLEGTSNRIGHVIPIHKMNDLGIEWAGVHTFDSVKKMARGLAATDPEAARVERIRDYTYYDDVSAPNRKQERHRDIDAAASVINHMIRTQRGGSSPWPAPYSHTRQPSPIITPRGGRRGIIQPRLF